MPPGHGEPLWVDDPDFDVARHMLPLGTAGYELDDLRFEMLCDSVLSVPLADKEGPAARPALPNCRCLGIPSSPRGHPDSESII